MTAALLTIDLAALVRNWRSLAAQAPSKACAAVIKADGYGLGTVAVGTALRQAGCRHFFVAHISEALALRNSAPFSTCDHSRIYVLNGLLDAPAAYHHARITPVINSREQLEAWCARPLDGKVPHAAVQIDTGMARLGFDAQEQAWLLHHAHLLDAIDAPLLMTHLASAEEPDNPQNSTQHQQLTAFLTALYAAHPGLSQTLRVSFANSSGIFLGQEYHFDLLRPGVALYGANPTPDQPHNPMQATVRLDAPIIQIRDIAEGQGVGYNATWTAAKPSRIATLALGYADGFSRNHSGRAHVYWHDQALPLVGRVSMDLVTVDISDARTPLQVGDRLEVLGPHQSLEDLAKSASTIPYEILTSLGARYQRVYVGGSFGDGLETRP